MTSVLVPSIGGHSNEASASVPAARRSVTIIGQGYVGLPLAMEAVGQDHTVCGYEIDAGKVAGLSAGRSHVEDIADATLARALARGRYRVTANADNAFSAFDVAVITVPTPLKDGLPDLSFVEEAARTLAPYLRPGRTLRQTVILESTTYPGTTEEVLVPLLEAGSGLTAGVDFHVGFSPERIDPGNKIWTLRSTTKVVSGLTPACLARVEEFYRSVVDDVHPVADVKSAEMAKIIENTFRHVNIALVNELAILAHELGIDIWEALGAAASKPFGYMKFTPGPGVGGHCLPIDPLYLSHRVEKALGKTFRFVELAHDINEHQPDYVVQRITAGLNRHRKAVNGSRILLVGLAYKANTADTRETPSSRVVELLGQLGAKVEIVDPHVAVAEHLGAPVYPRPDADLIAEYDAVVILTDHQAIDYAALAADARYVLDTRHVIDSPFANVEFI